MNGVKLSGNNEARGENYYVPLLKQLEHVVTHEDSTFLSTQNSFRTILNQANLPIVKRTDVPSTSQLGPVIEEMSIMTFPHSFTCSTCLVCGKRPTDFGITFSTFRSSKNGVVYKPEQDCSFYVAVGCDDHFQHVRNIVLACELAYGNHFGKFLNLDNVKIPRSNSSTPSIGSVCRFFWTPPDADRKEGRFSLECQFQQTTHDRWEIMTKVVDLDIFLQTNPDLQQQIATNTDDQQEKSIRFLCNPKFSF